MASRKAQVQPLVSRIAVDAYVVSTLAAPRRREALRIPAAVLHAEAQPHNSKWALSRFAAVVGGSYAAQATYWSSCRAREACLSLAFFPSALAAPAPAVAPTPPTRHHWWSRAQRGAPAAAPPTVPLSALYRAALGIDTALLTVLLLPNRALEAGVTLLLSGSGVLIAAPAGAVGALLTLGCTRLTLAQVSDAQAQQWLLELHWMLDIRRRVGGLLPWTTVTVPLSD